MILYVYTNHYKQWRNGSQMSNFQILLNAAQFLCNSSSWVKHLGRCMRSHKNMPAFHAIRELRCSKRGNSHDLDVAIMAIMARNIWPMPVTD